MDDEILKDSIESDPFHKGLAEHGEFKGFTLTSMTDEEKYNPKTTETGEKCARLPRCEVKGNGILTGACGFGATARQARKALADHISMETLVKNAYSDRIELKLPKVVSR